MAQKDNSYLIVKIRNVNQVLSLPSNMINAKTLSFWCPVMMLTKILEDVQKEVGFGPKRAILGNRGHETARRAAKGPHTGKLKVSRVTSGYGGHMIPLSRDRASGKNGEFIGVA